MLPIQEPKYDVNESGKLFNRETGSVIPDDEPVIILRARDLHAVEALKFYMSLCDVNEHAEAVESRVNDFQKFAADNPERMREPGSLRQEKSQGNGNYWTLDRCQEDALKYKTRAEWHEKSSGAYEFAIRNGVLNECCKHMGEALTKRLIDKELHVTMPDNSVWAIPVDVIARNRAAEYAHEFYGDVEESLIEDTIPLFIADEYGIEDWAENNMNWDEIKEHARMVSPPDVNYTDGWCNGAKDIVDVE